MALKLSIAAKDGGLPLPQPASMPIVENLVDIDSQSDISSVKSESSDDELLVLDADDKQEEPEQEPNQPKVKWSAASRDYHSNMTDGGFKLVGKTGKPSRTFTNSSLSLNIMNATVVRVISTVRCLSVILLLILK